MARSWPPGHLPSARTVASGCGRCHDVKSHGVGQPRLCAACYGRHRHSVNQPVFVMSSICCPHHWGCSSCEPGVLGITPCWVRSSVCGPRRLASCRTLRVLGRITRWLGGWVVSGWMETCRAGKILRSCPGASARAGSQLGSGHPRSALVLLLPVLRPAGKLLRPQPEARRHHARPGPDAAQLMSDDLASEAYVYGYPLMADVDEVIRFTGMGSVPAAPFNLFSHARTWRPRGHLRHSQQRHLGRRRWPWP